jgi:hypothetical protein
MVWFKLKISVYGPNLGSFGENEPLGSFRKRWDPEKALPCAIETAPFDVKIVKIGKAVSSGRGDKKRTK